MARKKSTTRRSRSKKKKPLLPALALRQVDLDRLIDIGGILLVVTGLLTALAMLPSDHPSIAQGWLDELTMLFGLLAPLVPLGMMIFGTWLVWRRFTDAPPPPWYRLLGLVLVVLALFGWMGLIHGWRAPLDPVGHGGRLGHTLFTGLDLALGIGGAIVVLLGASVVGLLFLFELSLAEVGRAARRLVPERRAKPAPLPEWPEGPRGRRAIQLSLPATRMRERSAALWERLRALWRAWRARRAIEPSIPLAFEMEAGPELVARSHPGDAAATTTWRLPPWERLLEEGRDAALDDEELRRKAGLIEETLGQFGVPAKVVEVNRGPAVTQFGVVPGYIRKTVRGSERKIKVKVSAITNLQNDLALSLAARRIRIEAPVPGKGYVGIEVPNEDTSVVSLRDTMESDAFQRMSGSLRIALGRDVSGNAVVADLARMPHLLIAGATGSGKSVCINGVVASLLCHNTPDQLKLLMVDPKMVELVGYNGIPHLIVPVVTDLERVVGLLRWTVAEMERRYKIFSELQVRNVESYNQRAIARGEKTLPYLVLVIDELADLMMAAADQVEAMICRLAQMARATGIHLILATQRPSVDVVTGLIKANFPARIAFAVTSNTDSRVILDRPGAESLLGSGDMLYMSADSSALLRAQGCFVSDRELDALNRYWEDHEQQRVAPAPTSTRQSTTPTPVAPVQAVMWDELLADEEEAEDELLPKARELVQKAGSASISMLQRRLRVGYARAARLVDLLEAEGSIGASKGPGKSRRVFTDEPEPGSDEDPGYDPSWVHEG